MKRTDDLLDVLKELSKTDKGITLINSKAEENFILFKDLWNRSYYVQELLKEHQVKKGHEVIMKCEDNEMFLYTFWGCVMGGFIAIPLDASKKNDGDTLLEHVIEIADNPVMVSDIYEDAGGRAEVIKITDYYEKITSCGDTIDIEIESSPDDIIYVQYSSGTTDKPHGVMITKSNVTANTYGFIRHYSVDETDRFISWSPLTHCYGMVTFHLVPLMARAEHSLISTKLYMSQPLIWAEIIDRYGATRIGSLPFALKLFDNVYEKSEKNFNWDLSRVKSMFIGGEQVNYALYKEFCDNVEQYGFGVEKVYPLYGLSEATIMVTANQTGKMAKTFHITNDKLMIGDVVECEEVKNAGTMDNIFLEMGTELETVQVSIRDDDLKELPERHLGNIFVNGPCITQGYYKDEEATTRVFTDDKWLSTGDVGFIRDGNLFVIGRVKELVVANGKKISCALIEDMVQKILADTSYQQCAVSNGVARSNENEKVIVFIKTDKELSGSYELKQFATLKNKIRSTVFEKTGLTISEVLPVAEIPKTSSGKAFRRKLTEDFNAGVYKEIVAKINGDLVEAEQAPQSALIYSRYMVEKKIVTYIEENFHVKATDLDTPIFEYGIVSINIPSFIEALNKEFGVKMAAGDIFSYFTIGKLSGYIAALVNTKEGQTMQAEKKAESEKEKIAIVGMSCRFPGGANSIEEYWKLLVSGEDGISEVPEDRWELDKYYDEDKTAPGKMYCKKGGFLNCGIDAFDARFFNISPTEAMALDPQQRILLELTWEAFENANMDIETYSGTNTGVYVGICNNEYNLSHLHSGDLTTINAYSLTGSCFSTTCGRISYTFGFEGPCVAVDTACSSALTALHLACNAMQTGDADMQIVAGINLMESPSTNIGFSKLQATSADGYSKPFDAFADGYGRGEGGGVLILKKLSDAIRDNNEILGIIRGSGMNQDGKSNGLTAPNGESQEKLIRKTMQNAGVTANEIDYVEMHGTGTKLGDPIEVGAVGATYGKNRKTGNLLKIGSVKSNIGHLEASAGVASIIKVLLCLKHQMIPANLHFHEPNPLIDWENSNVEVVDKHTPWHKKNKTRMAAINGFGIGGSNAHVIIEEYKQEKPELVKTEKQDGLDFMLKITAQSETSLHRLIQEYQELLEKNSDDKLEDIIYTANTGRTDLNCRFVVCGKNRQMLIDRMETYLKNGNADGVISNVKTPIRMRKDRKVVFMFTGQGSQYVNMGKLLYETNSIFRNAFDACSKLFRPYLVKSIADLVYGEKADAKVIERTVFAQPLIFAIEYALYKMWEHIGVKPEIVMGHSIGEYAAAVAAKIVTLEDAVKLVAIRARLMDMVPGHGKMAAIFASAKRVTELLEGYEENVCIAARNAAETCVISGEAKCVEQIEEKASQAGYRVKELTVAHAFHSMLMEPILDDFYEIAKEVQYNPAKVRFVSAYYGKELELGQILDADYWTKHIRKEVDFYQAVTSIEKKENYIFLEIGSNRVLAALCKLIFGDDQMIASSLSIKKEDKEHLPAEIAYVYAAGVQINWSRLSFAGKKNWKPQVLPNYPYDKKKYWMELQYDRHSRGMAADEYHPILGQKIDVSAMDNTVIFQSRFTEKEPYFMREHIIYGAAISPAAAHSAMLISAVNEISNAKSCVLEKIEFRAPLEAKEGEQRQVQICIQKDGEQPKFNIASRDYDVRNDKWLLHAKGNVSMLHEYQYEERKTDIAEYEKLSFKEDIEGSIYYFMLKSGFELGDGFRRIRKISYGDHDCVCCIEPLKTVPYVKDYVLYPGTIDSIFQTGIALVLEKLKESINVEGGAKKTVIPYYMEKLTYNYRESDKLWCYTKSTLENDITYANIIVSNEKGEVVMKVENLMAKITDSTSLFREMRNLNKLYFHNEWMPVEQYSKAEEKKAGTYILFADEESAMQVIAKKMNDSGVKPVCVLAGTGYEKITDASFVIRQGEKADWIQLLQDIMGAGGKKDCQIIYCSLKDSVPQEAGANMQYDAVKGLLYLMQVMKEKGGSKNSKIKIVTKNVQTIGSDKQTNLTGAMVWGLAKTASIEYPELFGGILDVDDAAINENTSVIGEILGDEVQEICIRRRKRYAARLLPHTEYRKKETDKKKKITVRKNASYLITGGTGALGTVYAEELVHAGAKNLVLLCRHEPGQKAKDMIQQFEREGVTVKLAYADVCKYDNLKSAMKEIAETMPPIRGVVHTAGVLNDKMMMDYDWDAFVKALQPKVCGTMNLYQVMKEDTLDFFIMLSSITSVIGNMGQANYSSANYFLNRFASFLNQKHIPGYTFCWGPWSESGMAAGKDAVANTMERMGMKSFEREQGQKIIEDFFQQPYETLLIADVDWNTLGGALKHAAGKTQFLSKVMSEKEDSADNSKEEQSSNVVENLMALPKEEQKNFLSGKLQDVCERIMGFEKGQLSPDDAFREQGADSLMIFSMRTAINQLLRMDINISAFFNYPSLTKLTGYILHEVLAIEEKAAEEHGDSVEDRK